MKIKENILQPSVLLPAPSTPDGRTESIDTISPPRFTLPQQGDTISYKGIDYLIGNKIGAGNFSIVYECWDEWHNRLAAKVIVPQGKTFDCVRQQWGDEFNKLLQLRHPCITYVHSAFCCDDTFYIVVERCDFTITELISKIADIKDGEVWLPWIARDILNGLHYIHGRGYVHKDLHARNIFVSRHYEHMIRTKDPIWSFKIGDVGISRIATDTEIFNTLLAQWMKPPEAYDLEEFGLTGSTKIGAPLDIYHFGLVLLSLLLGRDPSFTDDEITLGGPKEMALQLPSRFAPVVARALRRHANARYQSAIEMWRAIRSLI